MNWITTLLTATLTAGTPNAHEPALGELFGAWSGTVSRGEESTAFALELEPAGDEKVLVKMSIPITHVAHSAIGRAPIARRGDEVTFGPFALAYDRAAGTLTGVLPKALAPVYDLRLSLHRVPALALPERAAARAPAVAPVWTFDAGAPIWAGASFADGVVYVGGADGRLHAIEARTGRERWSFAAGGPIRSRPTVAGPHVYLQADDGVAYALAAADGAVLWRAALTTTPIVRLPLDDPGSRWDTTAAQVTVDGERLCVGTHDGRVVALAAATGARLWEFKAGDSVVAAPAVAGGRVYFGSYDGKVYALAGDGTLLWTHDTKAPVTSTPAVVEGRVLVGSRSYDFLALDAATGAVLWDRYVWFSWIESSAVVRDGVAYVGSSDAAALSAYDAASGRTRWSTDVFGWAWGRPLVSEARVVVGTAAMAGYVAPHRAGLTAVDRATGRVVWRYEAPAPPAGAYGFPGSVAAGDGLVFAAGIDGRVYAFAEGG